MPLEKLYVLSLNKLTTIVKENLEEYLPPEEEIVSLDEVGRLWYTFFNNFL